MPIVFVFLRNHDGQPVQFIQLLILLHSVQAAYISQRKEQHAVYTCLMCRIHDMNRLKRAVYPTEVCVRASSAVCASLVLLTHTYYMTACIRNLRIITRSTLGSCGVLLLCFIHEVTHESPRFLVWYLVFGINHAGTMTHHEVSWFRLAYTGMCMQFTFVYPVLL